MSDEDILIDSNFKYRIYSKNIKKEETRKNDIAILKEGAKIVKRYVETGGIKKELNPIQEIKIREINYKYSKLFTKKKKRPQRKTDKPVNLSDLTQKELDLKLFITEKVTMNYEVKEKSFMYIYPPFNEDWSILEVALNYYPRSWKDFFSLAIPELKHTNDKIISYEKKKGKSFPRRRDIFRAFELCPMNEIKVIIIGDAPVRGTDKEGYSKSNGLAYSVYPGEGCNFGMNNIRKKLLEEYNNNISLPLDSLDYLAKQGVLLLGSSLTIPRNRHHNHYANWHGFISLLLKYIVSINDNIVYCLFGPDANVFKSSISTSNDIIICDSPSQEKYKNSFFEQYIFKNINKMLESTNQETIEWGLINPDINEKKIILENITYDE